MTKEEVENEISMWINLILEFPDVLGIGEVLAQNKFELENISNDVPSWTTLEESKEFLIKTIEKLEILYDYAIKNNIKIVL